MSDEIKNPNTEEEYQPDLMTKKQRSVSWPERLSNPRTDIPIIRMPYICRSR